VLRTAQPFVFNNDVVIAIEGTAGTETHFTSGPTPAGIDTIENPSATVGSTPPSYHDGMFPNEVPSSIVEPQPDVTVKAIGVQAGRPSSLVVSARFQFKTASPSISGNNAALFTLTDQTVGAEMWYTTDGSDPTINGPTSTGPIISGTTLSLNASSDVLFKVRAFRPITRIVRLLARPSRPIVSFLIASVLGSPLAKPRAISSRRRTNVLRAGHVGHCSRNQNLQHAVQSRGHQCRPQPRPASDPRRVPVRVDVGKTRPRSHSGGLRGYSSFDVLGVCGKSATAQRDYDV
jgi:hypothetical protein